MNIENFDIHDVRGRYHKLLVSFNGVVVGLPYVGQLLVSSAIQGGVCHFLAEGVPGIGKTRSIEAMARLIGGRFEIIQFTPDLMPKDIIGIEYPDKKTGEFKIKWGKIAFANLILGDEINRGDTRTQSALLSPMSEGRVTIEASNVAGEEATKWLHPVNVFMCTQNPIEQEGTNPLPEAQHDRFLYKVIYDYPSRSDEEYLMEHPELADREILDTLRPIVSLDEIVETRKWVKSNMVVSKHFRDYALTVIRATRPGTPEFVDLYQRYPQIRPILDSIKTGISVRANMALLRACQVRGFLYGTNEDKKSPRNFVMPEDLKSLAHSTMRHRILTKEEAAYRTNKGDADKRWAGEYPTDGTITREQVVHRLNRPGKSPITSDHVIDALITHIDHTNDSSLYSTGNGAVVESNG
jgi:MoxR-like ATPases